MAEGVFRHQVQRAGLQGRIITDSAGMQGYHVGEMPDARAVAVAKRRGISLGGLVARKVVMRDFYDFDLILAMDAGHYQELMAIRPQDAVAQVTLFLEYAGHGDVSEVPDPYYGDLTDFEYVMDLVEEGARGVLEKAGKHSV